ncbi:MAG: VRR-NUC domain-containing protein [Cyanobium sp.]
MSEQELQQRIRLELGHGEVRLWRNNVGALRDERGRLVSYGLCRGSSDLIGLRQLSIGPEHLGHTLAVFCAIEVKTKRGRPTAEQQQFLAVVQELGGLAGVARSLPEAGAILRLAS